MAFNTFTKEQRKAFMEAYGTKVANFGPTSFGAYRRPREAFEVAKAFKPYADMGLNITEADYADFRRGFKRLQNIRMTMQLVVSDAQKAMHDILKETEIPSPMANVKHFSELPG